MRRGEGGVGGRQPDGASAVDRDRLAGATEELSTVTEAELLILRLEMLAREEDSSLK
jgi:hypothetical protein